MGWLKTLLSYLYEIPVLETSSSINPKLAVGYKNGRYMLSTQHAVYSFEDNYTTYRIAFEQLKPEQFSPKNILILGYGLGSIPLLLNKRHGIHARYTAVEIDPEVIRLAKQYGRVPEGSTVAFICMDALAYVKESNDKFDMICMDIFLDNQVPTVFESREFLQDLKALIAPEGWLLYNRLYYNAEMEATTDEFYHKEFQQVFPEGSSIDTKGNKMLIFQHP